MIEFQTRVCEFVSGGIGALLIHKPHFKCVLLFLFVYTRRRQVPFSTVSLVCKLIREITEEYTFD
jgi:hypothetical protein